MTQSMVEALRMEQAGVHTYLVSYDSSGTYKLVNSLCGKYYPAPQEFVYFRIKVTNLSCMSFKNLTSAFVTHAVLHSIMSSFYRRS
jgi:hypothetical protein